MSLSAHVPTSQGDLNKEVQTVIEDDILTTPSNYGTIPTNPSFTAVGPDGGKIMLTYSPELIKTKKVGSLVRTRVQVAKKSYKARLEFKASDNNTALQKWCKNKSAKGGTVTPAASRTFVHSYNIGQGSTETYEIFSGCLPEKTNITINRSGEIIYIVDLDCKTFTRSTAANGGITLGSGSFASADAGTPWLTVDGGAGAFTYNSVKYGIVSLSIDITRTWAMQNPSESLENVMMAESGFDVSGTLEVEKSDSVMDNDALATTARAVSIVLKSGTMTDTFTNFIFEGHTSPEFDGASTEALTDSGSFSADDYVSA